MIDSRLLRAACLTAVALACLVRGSMSAADEYRDPCEDNEPRWLISNARDAVVREGRNSDVFHEGKASKQITVEAQRQGSEVILSQKLPKPGRVIPELKATVWVRSERAGVRLYVHVLFPNQTNPRTGDVLGDPHRRERILPRPRLAAACLRYKREGHAKPDAPPPRQLYADQPRSAGEPDRPDRRRLHPRPGKNRHFSGRLARSGRWRRQQDRRSRRPRRRPRASPGRNAAGSARSRRSAAADNYDASTMASRSTPSADCTPIPFLSRTCTTKPAWPRCANRESGPPRFHLPR